MISTKNFNPTTDPKLLCTCGNDGCDRRSVSQWALDGLQAIRDDLGKPITVTSGGRCECHQNEIDREAPGDHQKQMAVDVVCTDEHTETKLKVLAGRHGATRVAGGVFCGFLHIAWTKTDRTDVPTWGY